MVKIILTLLALFHLPVNAFTIEIKRIESTIENLGTKVYWANTHDLCTKGLLGAYIPKKDEIFMCQGNHKKDYAELVATLKHEGWHAVQVKCNQNRAVLSDEKIRTHLKLRDRKNLHSYHPMQGRSEAEARVIEQIPTNAWIKGVRKYCQNYLKSKKKSTKKQ